ncbi:MAG: 4Fe-4S binding protein [Syntrophomonadaceae bacterium]|jgi:MinD superfamily P-loop ATPase|nr:4Fe-4S binding protein [Syntrophomonadaceae bacterium]
MKEILLLSGKGGTGKTSLTASFVSLAESCLVADYDVDATNLPILLRPSPVSEHEYSSGKKAVIDQEKCTHCGLCEMVCRFEAITDEQVDNLACEGCAYCSRICPVEAIDTLPQPSGRWFEGKIHPDRTFFYAELRPGEENSGKLVAEVKNAARLSCQQQNIPLLIADGPPGIGCPVNSALVGVDLVVLVGEPSISGLRDLQRIHQLLKMREIKSILVINKYDLQSDWAGAMEKWAQQTQVDYAGKIPYDPLFIKAAREGKTPADYPDLRALIAPIWQRILEKAIGATGDGCLSF